MLISSRIPSSLEFLTRGVHWMEIFQTQTTEFFAGFCAGDTALGGFAHNLKLFVAVLARTLNPFLFQYLLLCEAVGSKSVVFSHILTAQHPPEEALLENRLAIGEGTS